MSVASKDIAVLLARFVPAWCPAVLACQVGHQVYSEELSSGLEVVQVHMNWLFVGHASAPIPDCITWIAVTNQRDFSSILNACYSNTRSANSQCVLLNC